MRKSILFMLALGLIGCASAPKDTRAPANISRSPAAVDVLDVFDMEALHIYVSQGFMNDQILRDLIPLKYLRAYIDLSAAKTCKAMLENNVAYLDRVLVAPSVKLPPKDAKLYILASEALQHLPRFPGTFYQGSNICSAARDEGNRLRPEFIELSFMGVAESRSSAEAFTRKRDEVDDGIPSGCMMTIESKNSRRVNEFTGNFNDQREILFPRNTGFRLFTSSQSGLRSEVTYRELDPALERDAIERLQSENYLKTLRLYYPGLTGSASSRKLKKIERREIESEKVRLTELSEAACEDAEKFYSTDPKLRERVNRESPVFNLRDKKLNPDDYPAP